MLEWGTRFARLLYSRRDGEGRRVLVDGVEAAADGTEEGLPADEERAGAVLGRLVGELESRHKLRVQTLYCWLRGPALQRLTVAGAAAYQRRKDQPKDYRPWARLDGIPEHLELVDVFPARTGEGGSVLLMSGARLQALEKPLCARGLFLEEAVSFPVAGLDGSPAGRPVLLLGLFDDCSCAALLLGGELLHYQVLPFSVLASASAVAADLGLPLEQALELLPLAVLPPAGILPGAQERLVRHRQVLESGGADAVRDILARDLEGLANGLRQGLGDAGLWAGLPDEIIVLGEGRPLYRHFAFLRDILPFEPADPRREEPDLPDEERRDAFRGLLSVEPWCFGRRRLHRRHFDGPDDGSWKGMLRRVIGG